MRQDHEHNLRYVVQQALEREHGDRTLIEHTVAEAFIDACAHGYFGDRLRGLGPQHVRVYARTRSRGEIKLELIIPTLSALVIVAECSPYEAYLYDSESDFGRFDLSNSYVRRIMKWSVTISEGGEYLSSAAYFYGSSVPPAEEVKCACGKPLPSWVYKCVECTSLEAFERAKNKRIKDGMDVFMQICLTVGAILWQSIDDSSKRFAMLDLQPSKPCPPDKFEPMELEL